MCWKCRYGARVIDLNNLSIRIGKNESRNIIQEKAETLKTSVEFDLFDEMKLLENDANRTNSERVTWLTHMGYEIIQFCYNVINVCKNSNSKSSSFDELYISIKKWYDTNGKLEFNDGHPDNTINTKKSVIFSDVLEGTLESYKARTDPLDDIIVNEIMETEQPVNKNDLTCFCGDDFSNMIILNCNHGFHVECIRTWFKTSSKCPVCNVVAKKKSNEKKRKTDEGNEIEISAAVGIKKQKI